MRSRAGLCRGIPCCRKVFEHCELSRRELRLTGGAGWWHSHLQSSRSRTSTLFEMRLTMTAGSCLDYAPSHSVVCDSLNYPAVGLRHLMATALRTVCEPSVPNAEKGIHGNPAPARRHYPRPPIAGPARRGYPVRRRGICYPAVGDREQASNTADRGTALILQARPVVRRADPPLHSDRGRLHVAELGAAHTSRALTQGCGVL